MNNATQPHIALNERHEQMLEMRVQVGSKWEALGFTFHSMQGLTFWWSAGAFVSAGAWASQLLCVAVRGRAKRWSAKPPAP